MVFFPQFTLDLMVATLPKKETRQSSKDGAVCLPKICIHEEDLGSVESWELLPSLLNNHQREEKIRLILKNKHSNEQ